jgi:hypothetical protein
MISQRTEPPIVTFSIRVYQVLLVAYPTKFQQEYGSEMVQVFQDCCLRAFRQNGTNGMVRLWAVTLFDLVQSVISEHTQKEIEVKKEMKPEDIRMAGGALIWGAAAFVISLFLLIIKVDALSTLLMVFLIPPLLMVGLLGVRNRYGDKVGWLGRIILLIGVILGSLTSLIGFIGSLAGKGDLYWALIFSGPAVSFACLALFGIVALYTRPLPRWNVAPIIAGIEYPAIVFYYIIISPASSPNSVSIILITIQGIALAALGYILKSDVLEETVVPA